MRKHKMQLQVQSQITVGATATLLSTALGLSADDDCLVTEVMIQNDDANAAAIYIGGCDTAGVANVAANKCMKISIGESAIFCPEDRIGDEDLVVVDIRQISLKAPGAGYLVNVAFFVQTAFSS